MQMEEMGWSVKTPSQSSFVYLFSEITKEFSKHNLLNCVRDIKEKEEEHLFEYIPQFLS